MPTRRDAPELKLIKGAEPRERDVRSPRPARREPQPPSWLTPTQRATWKVVVDELREMDQLFAADTFEIVSYVVVATHAQHCAQELNELTSYVRATAMGGLGVHPLIAAHDRLVARAHQLAKHLGLNPAGRSAIHGRSTRANTEVERMDLFA